MRIEDVKPGDIIRIHGYSGDIDEYVFTDGEELYLNACSESWIARGLRGYGEEGYPLTQGDVEDAEIVGHYKNGWFTEGWDWYENEKKEIKQ